MTDNSRIHRIEEKIAFLEEGLERLEGYVQEVNRQLLLTRRELAELSHSVSPVDEAIRPEEDVPPHWGPPR